MIRLNLGSGGGASRDWINIDIRALPGVDIVRDVLRGLPFSDETVDAIRSENFLEHIPQGEGIWLMNEMWRVLKPGASASHVIPQAGTVIDYQDPTHLSRWHPETFTYFELHHARNRYYDGVKSWVVTVSLLGANGVMSVEMRKPA